MQFDRKQLDKLLSLDDESFKALTKTIAEAAGANKLKTEMMLNNPEILKSRLASLSHEEAQELLDFAGKEKSGEIMEILRQRGINFGQ